MPEFISSDSRTSRPNVPTGAYTVTSELQFRRHLLAMDSLTGLSVLDLGCCVGASGAWALSTGATKYVGVELQTEFASQAKKNLNQYFSNANWQINQQTFDEFFKSNTEKFDVVIALGIVYHSIHFESLIKNIAEICNKTIIIDSVAPFQINKLTNNMPIIGAVPYIEYVTNYGMASDDGVFPSPLRITSALPNIPALSLLFQSYKFELDKNLTSQLKSYFPESYAGRFCITFNKTETPPPFHSTETAYCAHTKIPPVWSFNSNVAETFNNHAIQHIPKYNEVISQSVDICKKLLPPSARIIDVGCAIGKTITELGQAGFTNLVGVDASIDMIEKCKTTNNAEWIHSESFPSTGVTYNAILCNWTLHFIQDKKAYLMDMYNNLEASGFIILTDKTENTNLALDLYHDFKRQQGVPEDEIQAKAASLTNTMFINSVSWYFDTFTDIGFTNVMIINAAPCFTTFLIQK